MPHVRPPHGSADDLASNPSSADDFPTVLARRLSRRGLLGGLAAGALWLSDPVRALARGEGVAPDGGFEPLPAVIHDDHRVAPGYRADVLVRWGDPVLADAPPFDAHRLDADHQVRQFGYNNDFIAYLPLPRGSRSSDHGLLCVNHEYTDAHLMWAGETGCGTLATDRIRYEMAAHGHSVLEVRRTEDGWRVVADSPFARRVTARTPMRLAGPAAGHPRLCTSRDPMGRVVLGTISNCAGGVTPWGTVLIAEENFNEYFSGEVPRGGDERKNHERYGLGRGVPYRWDRVDRRFDLALEPNEPNRFGYLVELDPYEPESVPIKRTALGRLKHEGASVVLNHDGRVVVYTGDDQAFEYLYKFVSDGVYEPGDVSANSRLLDTGTLHVARFDEEGGVTWLPLTFGSGPLVAANAFASQADVLIEARRAADLLGATPLDRPEDVEVDRRSGRVYAMLTNNRGRTLDQIDGPNPRAANLHGHVLELHPPTAPRLRRRRDGASPLDHAAPRARWEVFLRAGDPADPSDEALYHPDTAEDGWFSCPDNAVLDASGRLWIASDQGSRQAGTGVPDGLRAIATTGPERGLPRLFYACPRGAELCGPCFTPDERTLFVAVQHPGDTPHAPEGRPSLFDDPSTRWPDFDDRLPPRPSVVVIMKDDGGRIGA